MISKLGLITEDGWKELAQKAKDVEELAALCGVKVRQLQKFSRKRFGITPKRWLETEKMKPAIPLLQRGFKVVLVAREMGFKDAAQFNKVIRRCFNARPTDFYGQKFD